MRIGELVGSNRQTQFKIESQRSVDDAIDKLQKSRSGVLIVVEHDEPVGMISASDLLMACLRDRTGGADTLLLKDVMTTDMITAGIDDEIPTTLNMMLKTGIKYLPVTDDSGIIGILGLQDLMQYRLSALEQEVNDLKDYIADLHDAGLD